MMRKGGHYIAGVKLSLYIFLLKGKDIDNIAGIISVQFVKTRIDGQNLLGLPIINYAKHEPVILKGVHSTHVSFYSVSSREIPIEEHILLMLSTY